MLTLRDTVALALASTFVTTHVAALPHPKEAHVARAVDATAFTPWEMHPQERAEARYSAESLDAVPTLGHKKAAQVNDDKKGNGPEEKRAINPEGLVPYVPEPPQADRRDTERKPGVSLSERNNYETATDETHNTTEENHNKDTVYVVPSVPVGRRDLDPIQIIEQNRFEKPVHIMPIVGRAADDEASVGSTRTCGPDKTKYYPSRQFCAADGIVLPNDPLRSVAGAKKREAVPDPAPITDKLSCNGQRYLPSQQKCAADGLVSLTPPPLTAADDDLAFYKRNVVPAQCGDGIGSIYYDRATSYCNPITQQLSPIIPVTGRDGGAPPPLTKLGNQGPHDGKDRRDSALSYGPKREFAVL